MPTEGMPMDTLRIGSFTSSSTLYGPLRACVLHTQGCLRNCPGCGNTAFQDPYDGTAVSVPELLEQIRQAQEQYELDSLVISGGEPLLQAEPLRQLLQVVFPNLYTILYTGHYYEKLLVNPAQAACLNYIDLLIDGPYLRALPSAGWAGSCNQNHVLLSERIKDKLPPTISKVPFEIQVEDDRITFRGFPDDKVIRDLIDAGIIKELPK